jgi:orotate phosphoribosyltransferase
MDTKQSIAKMLLGIKAVALRTNPPYTWTSGIKAPIYCDNRMIISFPEERKEVTQGFIEIIKEKKLEFDIVAGTATAAIPFAAFLAHEINKPMVYIRHKSKDYGAGKQIEGVMPEGAKVLIVEDLISTGGSSLRSVEICREEAKADVVGVIAIFNYNMALSQKGFADAKVPLYTLTDFETLVGVATEQKYLAQEDKENVLAWSKDPENWGK